MLEAQTDSEIEMVSDTESETETRVEYWNRLFIMAAILCTELIDEGEDIVGLMLLLYIAERKRRAEEDELSDSGK